jgi:hypothetical protein
MGTKRVRDGEKLESKRDGNRSHDRGCDEEAGTAKGRLMSWWSQVKARLKSDDEGELKEVRRREHCAERWFRTAHEEAVKRLERANEESIRLLRAQASVVPHELREDKK